MSQWYVLCQEKTDIAYGQRVWNLNWPIMILKSGKALLSWRQKYVNWVGHLFSLIEDGIQSLSKIIFLLQKPYQIVKSENMKHFVSNLLAKNGSPAIGNSFVVRCRQVG